MSTETCKIPLGIQMGDTFKSFEEVDLKVREETHKNFLQYYRRDSRTVEAAKSKTKRYLNPALRYYQIKYACIHGGREHVPHGNGIRNRKTFRNEEICPANIIFRITPTGSELSVIKISNEHNHKVDKHLFDELPHQRKLDPVLKEHAKKLLQMNNNKHMIRQALESESNKIITLKDLSNLQQENRKQYENNIENVCIEISDKFGEDCHLLVDSDNYFKGLLFCTSSMMHTMNAYPEMICIDATHKFLITKSPVYIIFVEDGLGESEVVGIGILTREDSLRWLLMKFKEINPSCANIKNIIIDKDWTERAVLQECFPGSKILLSIFHIFKIFNREVTSGKMKITSMERTRALEFLEDLACATNQDAFDKIISTIENKLSSKVYRYFKDNLLDVSEEWCPSLGTKILSFMKTTNSRVECINAKLKSVVSLYSTLEQLVDQLFIILKSLGKEKRSRLAHYVNKRTVHDLDKDGPEYKYSKFVSEFALKKIVDEIKKKNLVEFKIKNKIYEFTSGGNEVYSTSCKGCECFFYTSMGLPCKHIFAVRNHLTLDLFNTNLVHERWTLNYILKHNNFFNSIEHDYTDKQTSEAVVDVDEKVLSTQEKYKLAFAKCKLIATLSAEVSGEQFKTVMSTLDNFIYLLENNVHNIQVSGNTNNNDEIILFTNVTESVDINQNSCDEDTDNADENIETSEIIDNVITIANDIENADIDLFINNTDAEKETVVIENEIIETDETIVTDQSDHNKTNDTDDAEHNESIENTDLAEIKIPPKCKKRGRPSGCDLAAIKSKRKRKLLTFTKLTKQTKIRYILAWILKNPGDILNKKNIGKEDLKEIPNIDVRMTEVDLELVKSCLSKEAYDAVNMLKQWLLINGKWQCPMCSNEIEKLPSMRCDVCLHWYHIKCITVSNNKSPIFVCPNCS